jgi:hypothetical protein
VEGRKCDIERGVYWQIYGRFAYAADHMTSHRVDKHMMLFDSVELAIRNRCLVAQAIRHATFEHCTQVLAS